MSPTAPVVFPPFPSQVGSGALSPHFVFVSWKLRETLIGKGPVSSSGLQTGQLLWGLIFLAINVYIESLNPGHLQLYMYFIGKLYISLELYFTSR